MSDTKFTKEPWSLCGAERGGCVCFTVGSPDHPIANIEHGEWGDEYVNVRLIDDPKGIGKLAEAFMDHSWYGNIPEDEAKANGYLIAAAPDMYKAIEIAENTIVQMYRSINPAANTETGNRMADQDASLISIRSAIFKALGK